MHRFGARRRLYRDSTTTTVRDCEAVQFPHRAQELIVRRGLGRRA